VTQKLFGDGGKRKANKITLKFVMKPIKREKSFEFNLEKFLLLSFVKDYLGGRNMKVKL
jgi:hypothetical protein